MLNRLLLAHLRAVPRHATALCGTRLGPGLAQRGMASQAFFDAKDAVQGLSEKPSNETLLKLYALFKQATEGPCNAPKPGMMDFVGKAKWGAWNGLKDMPQEEAERQYIALVQELLGQDAGAASGGAGDAAAAGEAGERHGIKYSVSDKGVATITIARPKRKNALDVETYRSIEGALKEAAASKAVRVVVLTGQGDYYSSGNDLGNFVGNMPPEGPEKLAADAAVLLEGFVNAFIEFPKPLVAAVNGPSIGIATTTLGLCDLVIASHTATFHTPFTALGQTPEACSSATFPAILGPAIAHDVLYFGRKLNADEAATYGLVTEVVSKENFKSHVARRVEAIAALPPGAMQESKRLVRGAQVETLKAVNAKECQVLKGRWTSDECMAAIMDFMNRKKE